MISSELYHSNEPDLILAAITSRISAASGPLDYVLQDWQAAGLRYPSAFKPVVFTLEPRRVLLRIGALSQLDMSEVDQRLGVALNLMTLDA